MSDDVWKRDEIDSPCIKICALHPVAKICIGCYRTGNEIAVWGMMSSEERRAVMDELPDRKSKLPGRRGGRRARRAT